MADAKILSDEELRRIEEMFRKTLGREPQQISTGLSR